MEIDGNNEVGNLREEAKNMVRKRKRKVDCMVMDESMNRLAASHIRKRAYLTF